MAHPEPTPHLVDTRERLLSAATSLFAARGFHGTTMREIAQGAGANLAAANYYFGSKEALYLEVLRKQFAEVRARLALQDSAVEAAKLARLRRDEVVAILRRRITAMLELLLGPPPALHATLMIREMTDPSAALPAVVAEFMVPQIEEMKVVVERLAPGLAQAEVERCIFAVVGQILYYCVSRPALLLMQRRSEYPRGFARQIAEHITEFSLGGLERLAARRTRGRHAT